MFKDLTGEEKAIAHKALVSITNFLNTSDGLFDSSDARAILAYELVSIPLHRFPKWLNSMKPFFAKRMETQKQFHEIYRLDWYERDGLPQYEDITRTDAVFPRAYQSIVDQVQLSMSEKIVAMEAIVNENKALALKLDVPLAEYQGKSKSQIQAYRRLYEDVVELASKLERNGVLAPVGYATRMYEYGEESYESRNRESTASEHVKLAVLELLDTMAPADRVAIQLYSNDRSLPEPKALVQARAAIKKAVHKYNQSRPVWVSAISEHSSSTSFLISVDYFCAEEDRNNGYKGATVDFIMYAPQNK